MNNYCDFHPTSPAKWRCNQCSRFFDNACVPKANEKQHLGQCPFCQGSLDFLFTENTYKSEHYPLTQLIKDCLTSTNIYLLGISIIIAAFSSMLSLTNSLKLLLCFFGILFLNLHIARQHTYLRHEYQRSGSRKAFSIRSKKQTSEDRFSMSSSAQLTFLAGLLLLFPIYCFYALNWFIGLILIVAGACALPYLIIFSLHSSDNDLDIPLAKLFKELKPDCLFLSLQSLGLYWLVVSVTDLLMVLSPLIISLTISSGLSAIGLFILLNYASRAFVLGTLKLGVHQKKLPTSTKQDNLSTLDTDIDLALKTGQYHRVVGILEEAVKRNSTSHIRKQQLFILLYELKDLEKLSRYADVFLHWMLERNKIKDASKFIYLLRKNNPAFLLHDIELRNRLAKQFFRTKKYALVQWLAEDAKEKFKPSEALAGIYLSAAQAMVTHYKDHGKAEEYLLFVFQACSEFPSAEAAKALLIHLQNNQKKQQDLRL